MSASHLSSVDCKSSGYLSIIKVCKCAEANQFAKFYTAKNAYTLHSPNFPIAKVSLHTVVKHFCMKYTALGESPVTSTTLHFPCAVFATELSPHAVYRICGLFSGDFNLADWRIFIGLPNLNHAVLTCTHEMN